MDADTAISQLEPEGVFPREALGWVQDNWPEVSDQALALCAAVTEGRDETPESQNALFFLLHAGAAARATELHAPLCSLLLDGELSPDLLSDAITEHLGGMLISTFDGDTAPLVSVVESTSAYHYARVNALLVLAWLVDAGRLPRDWMIALLRRLHGQLEEIDEELALAWTQVVAILDLRDLEQDARKLYATHISRELASPKEFFEDLSATRRGVKPHPAFEEYAIFPFEDAVETLSTWTFDRPLEGDEAPHGQPVDPNWIAQDPQDPHLNPHRRIGRNDPCPCGSGKKYKKCCLAA